MAKSGEINYLKKMPAEYKANAINKPFSEPACANYLLDLGSLMTLLPSASRKLLDLGCGTGWTSCFFAKRGYEVTSQDIPEDMIFHARRKSEKEGPKNIAFVCCDFENADFLIIIPRSPTGARQTNPILAGTVSSPTL